MRGATVGLVEPAVPVTTRVPAAPGLDEDSREWLRALRADGASRDDAVARLHALLLRAARFEVARRRPAPAAPPRRRAGRHRAARRPTTRSMSVLRRLDDFRGESRFTTWAYKFALLEAAVKLRKRAWQGREVPLEPESLEPFASAGLGPDDRARAERAAGDASARDRRGADAAPAPGARRAGR